MMPELPYQIPVFTGTWPIRTVDSVDSVDNMYRSSPIIVVQNECIESRILVFPSQINRQINNPSLRSRLNSSSSLIDENPLRNHMVTPDSRTPGSRTPGSRTPIYDTDPFNFSTTNVLVLRTHLEHLEFIERNISTIVADGLTEYIRNENLNLESLETSSDKSDDDTLS